MFRFLFQPETAQGPISAPLGALAFVLGALLVANVTTCPVFGQTNTFPSSGNVGIGTTSPGVALDVVGNANFTGTLTSSWTNQDLRTTASPTFVGTTFSGAVSGITTLGTTGNVTATGAYFQQTNSGSAFDAYLIYATAATTDEKYWRMQSIPTAHSLSFQTVNDAYSSATSWMTVLRSGESITSVIFPVAGSSAGFTSTGLNSTAIGATTASTGAFTTLGATGIATIGPGGTGTVAAKLALDGGSGTNGGSYVDFKVNGADKNYVGTDAAINGGASTDLDIWSVFSNVNIAAANNKVATFSSTGLNSTAIGATTPSTGAFTTLSTNGTITSTGGNAASVTTPAMQFNNNRILNWYDSSGGNTHNAFVWVDGNNAFKIGTNNTTAFTLDTSQNATFAGAVTIGNSLTVSGNISAANVTATGAFSASGATSFTNTGTTTFAGPISSSSGNLTVSSAGISNNLLLNPNGGSIGIGTTNPQGTLHLQSTQSYNPQELIENIGNTGSGYLIFQKSRAGQTAITNGDGLGSVMFEGYSNGGYQQSAYLAAIADVVPSGSNVLSALTFNSRNSNGTLTEKFRISSNGNVGIGTANPSYLLSVSGTIQAKEVLVQTGWSDYVFDPSYRLAPLSEVKREIQTQRHLPGIPSAKEVTEHGIKTGEMEAKLLAKIEELTLHMIDQEERMEDQASRIDRLEKENTALRTAH